MEQCMKIAVGEYIRDFLNPFYALEAQSELTDNRNSSLSFHLFFIPINLTSVLLSVKTKFPFNKAFGGLILGLIPRLLELVIAQ